MRYSGGGHCGAIHCQLQAVAPGAPLLFFGGGESFREDGQKKRARGFGTSNALCHGLSCGMEYSPPIRVPKVEMGLFPCLFFHYSVG